LNIVPNFAERRHRRIVLECSEDNMSNISSDRLLNWFEVNARVRLGRSTVWRLERAGKFPLRIHISPGRVAWRESEIDDFVAGRWKPKTYTV
jgi:prophage regulatory protein